MLEMGHLLKLLKMVSLKGPFKNYQVVPVKFKCPGVLAIDYPKFKADRHIFAKSTLIKLISEVIILFQRLLPELDFFQNYFENIF